MSAAPNFDFRNTNALWSSVFVATLARLGLRHAVISPGSRSTPLTIQFARHPEIDAIPVLDERSAAFFALGLARQTNRPVVLLCTSGTAGANYFPAIIEAQESGVPLLVITADRPPAMRACRSGQTIDQQKLFGAHVNFYHELAVPEATLASLRYVRQMAAHAWERCAYPVAGPIHLNAPFRDPLPPTDDGIAPKLADSFPSDFLAAIEATPTALARNIAAPTLCGRGIIVAGQTRTGDAAAYAWSVGQLARKLGWPVLADALSPLRNFAHVVPGLVTNYDLLARSAEMRTALQPEHVLCLHDWPTSKALRQWIQSGDVPVTFVAEGVENPDSLHARTTVLRTSVAAFGAALETQPAPAAWLRTWQAAQQRVQRLLRRELSAAAIDFEGHVAALLPLAAPRGTTFHFANSMPVRDAEYFWPANKRQHLVHCNRGTNGIDGTLSTALGLAQGGVPVVLLTGDLALLHDTNGFLITKQFKGSLTVVLINNDGGGIFEHLPVAKFEPPFEEFFATPQSIDFRALCATYGVKHVAVRDLRHLAQLVKKLPARGVRVLEMRTNRQRDAAWRQACFSRIAARLA
ncbi:MAG: 2-succinyl-5-enolpyruvyl-6-hydroxy-3-cyclohexene-1-carboxylic-acid synthase [Candidatus Didemnitutus sp.]|nr:2-succinyl-5-enolpyruvyl-6-hydroxy-3-cyclohexene-1-carboxylic-acid synthase [Candidatus Didemnitutus sp.]